LGSTKPPTQWAHAPIYSGVKRRGRDSDCPPPCGPEDKDEWSYNSIPATCLHKVYELFNIYLFISLLSEMEKD